MSYKPFSIFGKPSFGNERTPADQELRDEVMEEARDRKILDERNARGKKDAIGDLIQARNRVDNKVFSITYRGASLTTTFYYVDKNAAIDVFESIGRAEASEIAFKRSVFKRSGVRYAALDYKSELASILEQLEA